MKFSEVPQRVTGISCPIFGVSWEPGVEKVASPRQVLIEWIDERFTHRGRWKFANTAWIPFLRCNNS